MTGMWCSSSSHDGAVYISPESDNFPGQDTQAASAPPGVCRTVYSTPNKNEPLISVCIRPHACNTTYTSIFVDELNEVTICVI